MSYISDRLTKIWHGRVELNCPLAKFSSIGTGGPAEALVVPESISDLAHLIKTLSNEDIPYYVIGRGSNLIISDRGVSGVVLLLGEHFARIKIDDECLEAELEDLVRIRIEAGCTVTRLLNFCVENELSGLEFLAGIPGSIGGVIVMNAGAMGQEVGEFVDSVTMIDKKGEVFTKKTSLKEFKYRQWTGAKDRIIVEGNFILKKGRSKNIRKVSHDNIKKRNATQPQSPSAGSIFKNPPGDYSGRLIEKVGLKGVVSGGAQISLIHANFIVNNGDATSADVLALVEMIKEKVKREVGVSLELEVKIIGD